LLGSAFGGAVAARLVAQLEKTRQSQLVLAVGYHVEHDEITVSSASEPSRS